MVPSVEYNILVYYSLSSDTTYYKDKATFHKEKIMEFDLMSFRDTYPL